MQGAFEWISWIAQWLGQFVPRKVILDTTMGGVKFVGGNVPKILGPGTHWYWPWHTMFQAYPTVRQTDELRSQTLTTADDKVIMVAGLITYEVFDLTPLLVETFDAATLVKERSLAGVHDACCRMSWEELKAEQRKGTLNTKLKNAVKRELQDYGVAVLEVSLTDLAPTRVLKVMQSVITEAQG